MFFRAVSKHGRRRIYRSASLLLALTVALVVGAIPASAAGGPGIRVIGGDPVPDGKYPFIASILFKAVGAPTDRLICTGSLIDPQWVLTAAHCVDGGGPEFHEVSVGRTVLSSDQGEQFDVAEIFVHPLWDGSGPHDVALLKLDGASSVTPIQLSGRRDRKLEEAGTVMTIAGWGITDPYDNSSTPDRMESADVPTLSDEQCNLGDLGSHYICAGSLGVTGCYGDSGGPLFYTLPDGSFLQMGTTHAGPACGGPYTTFMDLNDADIIQFIDATLKGKKSPFRIPEEPCPDGFGEDTYLENHGDRVETEEGHLLRAEFSGIVCRKNLDDRFSIWLEPGPIDGKDPFVGGKLRFDPRKGDLDLRFTTCVDELRKVCSETEPTVSENADGSRSMTWTNTTGDWIYAAFDVVLSNGHGMPYTLEMFMNIPAPPPPPPSPTCHGSPSADDAQFQTPGVHHFTGTVCTDVPWDSFETTMSEDSKLSADLQMSGSGVAGVWIASCDQDWNCDWTETVNIDETGAASVSWTNCEVEPRKVFVVVEHLSGQQTMNYELDVNAETGVGAC